MDYKTLSDYLSQKLGLEQEKFQLDFEFPEDVEYDKFNQEKSGNYYLSHFEHWFNSRQNWRSIKLFIPNGVKEEVIEILNEYLSENDVEEIDKKNIPIEFSRDQEGFNLLLGQNKEYLILEIAQKAN